MVVKKLIKKQTYYDSVTLMLAGSEIKKLTGVTQAVVGMCTDYNIDSLKRLELFSKDLESLTPNDLIICVGAINEETADNAIEQAQKKLASKKSSGGASKGLSAMSQSSAAKLLPDANITLISIPGEYATKEAFESIKQGRHVMLFSDNVSIEDEIALKKAAIEKNLLMMGPDCGTAIINQTPLAFANKVKKGTIGVVAASGTGLQEVTSIIDRFNCGISQAIGTGGRDLSEKVGGLMTIAAAKTLAKDPDTKTIVILSKPPAKNVAEKLFKELKSTSKPVVVYFIGADPKEIEKHGFIAANNLEDAALKACDPKGSLKPEVSEQQLEQTAQQINLKGKYIRGLYSGGTLCDEAQRILLKSVDPIYSNTPVKGCETLPDIYKSTKNTIIDLGDDDFTRGRAHPMIDPAYRKERLIQEAQDEDTAIIIFDVVLGFGSHMDMASEIAQAISQANTDKAFAACLCGTMQDPQDYEKQKTILQNAKVHVFPTNASLVTFAQKCLERSCK